MGSLVAASPRFTARMTGVFYVLYVVLAALAGVARRGLIVGGDAATTAANIMAHQGRYELGFACDLAAVATYVVVVILVRELMTPVSGRVSLLAAAFGFIGCTLLAVGGVLQLAPLSVLGQSPFLRAFTAEQLHAQAYLFLKLYNQAYSIALIMFGFFDLLVGYLILRSTFLPRILGVLMMLAGMAFLPFLAPTFGAAHLKWILPLASGELLLILWLLIKGVDAQRWMEQARSTSEAARGTM